MIVWVVMGNDFPAGVFSTEGLADAYIEACKANDEARAKREGDFGTRMRTPIHWRAYKFEVDHQVEDM